MRILLFYLLVVLSSCVSQGMEIGATLKDCCLAGAEAGKRDGDCRNGIMSPDWRLPQEHLTICLSAGQLCCANALRMILCDKGKGAARNGGSCPDMKKTDEQYCCESCKLGLITGSLGSQCTLTGGTSFGRLWDSAYESCCKDSLKQLHPAVLNKEAPANNVNKLSDEASMCEMFPGELCAHICIPTADSYECRCFPGFNLMADKKSCKSEVQTKNKASLKCSDGNSCTQICKDTPPTGYECSCEAGFRLDWNNSTCKDIDECLAGSNKCKKGLENCVNTIGSYKCVKKETPKPSTCQSGFKFDAMGKCVDINECTEIDDSPCDSTQICENTVGSFRCVCRPGFQLDSITHACIDINECQVNLHNCLATQRCDNTIGSFQCIRYTNCGTGYTLNSQTGQCEDDDECSLGTDTCRYMGEAYQCRNTRGSFRCDLKNATTGKDTGKFVAAPPREPQAPPPLVKPTTKPQTQSCPSGHCGIKCPVGYENRGNICVDINECDRGGMCQTNQRCINTRGSFTCTSILNCQPGFKMNSGKTQCVDIDECTEQHGLCSHNCINLWGSFMCTCKTGFILNTDNRTCSDVNECELYHDKRLCMGYCVNQLGSFSCQCPQGYRLGRNGATCEDIDECVDKNVCTGDEMCLNMRGNYRCTSISCPPGYIKDNRLKNRCSREADSCPDDDLQCHKKPLSYTFHFITLVSNLTIPRSGKIDLFSMRGPLWSSTTVDFNLELERARAPPDISPATRQHFALTKVAFNQAGIALIRPLEGPQDIQLKLTMEFYNHGMYGGKTISNIDIYVSQYPF